DVYGGPDTHEAMSIVRFQTLVYARAAWHLQPGQTQPPATQRSHHGDGKKRNNIEDGAFPYRAGRDGKVLIYYRYGRQAMIVKDQ
ncbi:MAG: hypothetical protein M3N10_07595, partial [Actinomycetota bacterium]|nr:hypothetical protein [Actinomycetota bacterium]